MLFLPGYLIDSAGRVLLDPNGESEPDAVLPTTAELPGWYADGAVEEEGDEGDEDYEPMPPDAEKAMRRALVLAAITARALTENEEPQPDDMEGFRRELNEWLSALGLDEELEPAEAEPTEVPDVIRRADLAANTRARVKADLGKSVGTLAREPESMRSELEGGPLTRSAVGVMAPRAVN